MNLHIRVPVAPEFLSDVLETALYGAIDYWCAKAKVHQEVVQGTKLIMSIDVREEGETEFHEITHASMVEAIQKICENEVTVTEEIRSSIYAAVTENDAGQIDATAADVIVQVAALGEIVYG
jgi:hypothetical protein